MVLSSVVVFFFNTSMMLWLVILLLTMDAKCVWMPFPVKKERRAVERHWFWEKSDIFPVFFLLCTHSLWNSNLGMTNTVITFTIDLVSFELQMCNLDIWLVRSKVLRTMEKQIWGSSRSQTPPPHTHTKQRETLKRRGYSIDGVFSTTEANSYQDF